MLVVEKLENTANSVKNNEIFQIYTILKKDKKEHPDIDC